MYNAGFKSVSDLAKVDAESLIHQIDHLSRRQARQIVAGAKVLKNFYSLLFINVVNLNEFQMLFHEKIELLKEQAEEFFSTTNAKGDVSVEDIVAALREFD